MAFLQEHSFGEFGQQTSPVSLAITGVRTVSTIASLAMPSGSMIGISTGGGAMIGISVGVLGVVGLVLGVIAMIYNFITGEQQRKKAEHKMSMRRILESIQMGKQVLISYGYNPELVNQLPMAGLYAVPNLYDDKQALMNMLSIYGIDASRFIYEAPVLGPEFTGNIERDLRVRELLIYMEYDSEKVNKTDWRINVNMFDALYKLSTSISVEEVKIQIERARDLISKAGLDPTKFMQTILQNIPASDTMPFPTGVVTDTALQTPEVEVQKVGFSISPLVLIIGIGILVLSRIKG